MSLSHFTFIGWRNYLRRHSYFIWCFVSCMLWGLRLAHDTQNTDCTTITKTTTITAELPFREACIIQLHQIQIIANETQKSI